MQCSCQRCAQYTTENFPYRQFVQLLALVPLPNNLILHFACGPLEASFGWTFDTDRISADIGSLLSTVHFWNHLVRRLHLECAGNDGRCLILHRLAFPGSVSQRANPRLWHKVSVTIHSAAPESNPNRGTYTLFGRNREW